ncbi:MAG: hypothetical protein KG029_19160 [Bacteroidetes bacterium]|nr:hypothetical protein [Bacteroidota bacterium]
MKTNILHPFENIPYFTIEALKQSAGIESPHSARVLLHRWAKTGHIFTLKKGVYMTARFYERHRAEPQFAAVVSAILLPQSYLSLEYILQQHNLMTEVTYLITCITTKNTRTITNAVGTFTYRNIQAGLYDGFSISEYFGIRYATATLGKALFDYLYLRPIPARYRSRKNNLAEELRLNLDEVELPDQQEFARFVHNSKSVKMTQILENFRKHIWQT